MSDDDEYSKRAYWAWLASQHGRWWFLRHPLRQWWSPSARMTFAARHAPQAFARGAWQAQANAAGAVLIGKKVRVTVQGKPAGTATIVDAKASDGGRAMELTYQFEGEAAGWLAEIPAITEVSLVFPPAEPAP
jgi:hypothetical protein